MFTSLFKSKKTIKTPERTVWDAFDQWIIYSKLTSKK